MPITHSRETTHLMETGRALLANNADFIAECRARVAARSLRQSATPAAASMPAPAPRQPTPREVRAANILATAAEPTPKRVLILR